MRMIVAAGLSIAVVFFTNCLAWYRDMLVPPITDSMLLYWIVLLTLIVLHPMEGRKRQCIPCGSLIAAAPDLYVVCKEIEEHGTDDWEARMKTLRAALRKAHSASGKCIPCGRLCNEHGCPINEPEAGA